MDLGDILYCKSPILPSLQIHPRALLIHLMFAQSYMLIIQNRRFQNALEYLAIKICLRLYLLMGLFLLARQ